MTRLWRPSGPAVLARDTWQAQDLSLWVPGSDWRAWTRRTTGGPLLPHVDLTLTGSPVLRGGPHGGLVMQFDGSTARAERAAADPWSRSTSTPYFPITFAWWAVVDSLASNCIAFSSGAWASTERFQAQYNTDGSAHLFIINSGGTADVDLASAAGVITVGVPLLYVARLTYDGVSTYAHTIWVFREDGSLAGSGTSAQTHNWTWATRLSLAARWNASNYAGYLPGRLWDLRVWSGNAYAGGLTDEQVWSLARPETRYAHYWTPTRRTWLLDVSAASPTTLTAGDQPVVVTAPTTTLSLGALTLAAGTQAVVVTAPTASLSLGAVTLSAGTQPVVVTAPTATLVQGGITTLAAGDQAVIITPPAPTLGLGPVTVAAGAQPVVVTAPAAALVTPVVTTGAYVELGTSDRTSVTLRAATLEYRVRGAGTLSGRFVAPASAFWRPQLLDPVTVWDPAQLLTGTDMAAGSTLLVRSAGGLTSSLVGQHVRVAGAAQDGHALLTAVASCWAASVVAVDMAASTTVTGAVTLAGRARFTGTVRDLTERRRGPASATVVYDLDAEAVSRVPDVLYPSSQARPAETLYRRAQALVDAGLDDHGLLLDWPLTSLTLALEAGGDLALEAGGSLGLELGPEGAALAAAAYDGTATFAALLDAMVTEDATGRQWRIDALGRLHVDATASTMPTSLTAADLIGLPTVRYALEDYANRIDYYFGEDLASVVTLVNSTEVAALNGRIYLRPVNDTTTSSSATAYGRAVAELAAVSTRTRYGLTFATLVDSLEPGQVGLIALAPHSIAGTHYLQTVRSTYRGPTLTHRWRHEVTAVNSTPGLPVEEYVDFWEETGPEALSDLERSLRQWAAGTFQQA